MKYSSFLLMLSFFSLHMKGTFEEFALRLHLTSLTHHCFLLLLLLLLKVRPDVKVLGDLALNIILLTYFF